MLAFCSLPVVYLNFMTQQSCTCTKAMHMSRKANLGLVVVVLFSKCPPLFSQPCVVLCCEPHCLTGKRMLVPQRTLHLGEMTALNTGREGDESRKHSGVSRVYIFLYITIVNSTTLWHENCSWYTVQCTKQYYGKLVSLLGVKSEEGVFILKHSICLLWV